MRKIHSRRHRVTTSPKPHIGTIVRIIIIQFYNIQFFNIQFYNIRRRYGHIIAVIQSAGARTDVAAASASQRPQHRRRPWKRQPINQKTLEEPVLNRSPDAGAAESWRGPHAESHHALPEYK